ncbi:MAG: serine/threonine-protein phosphatase [bacterium]|nr:serine/threonine-protein phosphatase [bacterium]
MNGNNSSDNYSLSNDFPIAQAVLDENLLLLETNIFFNELFEITPGTLEPHLLEKTFKNKFKRLAATLKSGSSEKIIFSFKTVSGNKKYILFKSAQGEVNSSIIYYTIFIDVTEFQELIQYLNSAFDQFKSTTSSLEKELTSTKEKEEAFEENYNKLITGYSQMNKDMNLAMVLQNSLLPTPPASRHWRLSYFFKPMAGVSGDIIDFYDFSDVYFDESEQEENLGILLLDASGHGVSSALITAIARPIFYKNHRLHKDDSLAKAIKDANIELCREIGHISNYLTGITLRLSNNHFSYVNAAHPYIIYKRAKTGKIHELDNNGILLGLDEFQGDFTARKAEASRGDILLLYTDGLIETKNPDGEEFGVERVKKIIAQTDGEAKDVKKKILSEMTSFGIDLDKLRDDMTFVVIKKVR